MKISELRGKTADQLASLLLDLKKESFNLRFQKVSGELEKTSRVREVRRGVARVNTLLNEIAHSERKGGADA
jgi:large subunit ribosomal protein L29